MNHKIKLSALFMKEGGAWVGQCLEHDIAAQGKTLEEAKLSLQHTIAAQLFVDVSRQVIPLEDIKPAPSFYKRLFDRAEKLSFTFELREKTYDATLEDARLALA